MIEDSINEISEEVQFEAIGSNLNSLVMFLHEQKFKIVDIQNNEDSYFFILERDKINLMEKETILKQNNFFIEGSNVYYPKV